VNRGPKPADVRFYFDADVLGLAKVVTGLRPDATYPGDPGAVIHRRRRPPCPVPSPAALDTEWIPVVARRRWLIITRDNRIQLRTAELLMVREHGAKLVALSGVDAIGTRQQFEIVMTQWRALEKLSDRDGPFVVAATRTGLRDVALR